MSSSSVSAAKSPTPVMRAIVQTRYGSPDALGLQQVPQPVPADGEVLVRVRAAGVNWADYSISTGVPYLVRLASGLRRPRHPIPGTDVSGEIVAVGPGATAMASGQHVFGWCRGSFAEYVCASAADLAPKPERISFEQAAATPMAGMVALQALRDVGGVDAGQRVLIVGASGGIGSFAVQIAKAMGAHVTGVCSTGNVELVESLGADRVIDYTEEDYAAGDQRYDFILDIADDRSLADRRRLLTPNGTLVPNSGEGGRWAGSLGRIIGARVLSMFVRQRLHPFLSTYRSSDLAALGELIDSGAVEPAVGRTFPLERAAEALRYAGARHAGGKTVLTVGGGHS